MKGIFTKIAAIGLVAIAGISAAGCASLKPDKWWDQLTCGEHTFDEGEVVKAATCEEEGEILKVCVDCGKEKTEKIEKVAHIVETVLGKEATCDTDGYTDGKKCVVCGVWTEAPAAIAATGHEVVEDEAIAATCSTPGLTAGSHCKTCGTVIVKQEETSLAAHIDKDNNGTCDVCKGSIFENATFATVAKGDVLNGWYRIGMAPAVWGDEGPTNYQTGSLSLGTAKISSDNENVTLNSSATASLMLDNTNSGTLQYETLDIELVNDDHEKPDGWSVYVLGQNNNMVKGFTFVGEYTYIYFRDIVTVNYIIGGMVDSVEQTQQKTVTVSGFTFDSCTFTFDKVIF